MLHQAMAVLLASMTLSLPADAAVISTLHLFLGRESGPYCLNPELQYASITSDWVHEARRELREDGVRRPSAAQLRAHLLEDEAGSWGRPDADPAPLSTGPERDIAEAFVDMAIRRPRQTPGKRLDAAAVFRAVRLEKDCPQKLAAPAIRGDWAFVGRLSATAGHLFALRRGENGWSVVAHRITELA